jgi:hypothetical protein
MKQPTRWKRGRIYLLLWRDHVEHRDRPAIMGAVGRLAIIGRHSLTLHTSWPEDEDLKTCRYNFGRLTILRNEIITWKELT